jgi:hypothetical protein
MSFIQKVMPPAKESFQNYRVSSQQSNPKRRSFSGYKNLDQQRKRF